MKFFLDHDVPHHLGELLKRYGHEVTVVREVMSPDADDEKVFMYATRNHAIMVTCNRNHFLDLAKLHHHCGLIVIVRRETPVAMARSLLKLLEKAGCEGLDGNVNFAQKQTFRNLGEASFRSKRVSPVICDCVCKLTRTDPIAQRHFVGVARNRGAKNSLTKSCTWKFDFLDLSCLLVVFLVEEQVPYFF